MKQHTAYSLDFIKRAVAEVKRLRPAYETLLEFYEGLVLAQEASKNELHLDPINIPKDQLSLKIKEKFPLIDRTDFKVDVKASEGLLRKICHLAAEASDVLAEAGTRVMKALDEGKLDASVLFSKILTDGDEHFEQLAKDLEIDKKALALVAYSSIKPSLCLCAEQLSTYLKDDREWGKGYCPVCGSPPSLSMLRGEGERSLICGFCSHEWSTQRIYCPFCDNRDQQTQRYFFSEQEEGYRVDVCDKCHKYIKALDLRKLKHPVYPFVEQVSTLHLDMLAQEQGLESGISLWLQT